jgi:hypothetical protein
MHCLKVYDVTNCRNFCAYHMTYLKCDVLLLADVFGTFRTASCILNKTETISQGKNIYSLVTFAMKEDGNGVYHDEHYLQEGCNGMPTWQDRAIIFVEKTDVNGVSLFEIERTNLDGSTKFMVGTSNATASVAGWVFLNKGTDWNATYTNLITATKGTASNEWLKGRYLFIDN